MPPAEVRTLRMPPFFHFVTLHYSGIWALTIFLHLCLFLHFIACIEDTKAHTVPVTAQIEAATGTHRCNSPHNGRIITQSDCKSPHRGYNSSHSTCEDHPEPVLAPIVPVIDYIEAETSHIVPITSYIAAMTTHIEDSQNAQRLQQPT